MPLNIFNGSFTQFRGSLSVGPFNPSAAAAASIVTTTLTHHFDAGTGSSYPGSGNKWNNLITTGNSSGSQLWFPNGVTYVDAGASSYFVMDGVDDYIRTTGSTNNRPLITSGTFTANLVCNFVVTGSGTNRLLTWSGAALQLLVSTTLGSAEIFPVTSGSSGFADILEITPGSVANRNQNVMLTWTSTFSGSVKLYVNGTLFGTSSVSQFLNIGNSLGPSSVYIWSDSGGSPRASGSISHFMFYTSSLSDADVLQNYNALKTRYSLP